MKIFKVIVSVVIVFFIAGSVHALDPIPQKSGFSGFVRAGVGAISYKSNMVAGNKLMDVGESTISSLDGEPDRETSGVGMVNFDLSWTFASTRTQVTLGSQLEDVARMELAQQLAVKQELPDKSIISLGFLFTGFPSEVWKDPYVTGTPREETDRTSTGVRFVYDRILGSAFEFRYSYRKIEIDDEMSGDFLGLSSGEKDLLRRDGDRHYFDLNYTIDISKQHRLIPGITYFENSRDGKAMSNKGGDVKLSYFFFNDPVILILNGLIGRVDYDEDNPIYSKGQEDDRYSFGAQVYYRSPFGWKPFGSDNFSVFGALAYLNENSNIDFYDTEAVIGQAGVMFRF